MSSGTFGYPLCFTAMLFAIGLMVTPPAETSASGKSCQDRGTASEHGVAPGPVVMGPTGWNRLFNEAEQAFTAKNYDIAILKLRELLGVLGDNRNAPLERLCFNIGLASLLNDKNPEAEAAFSECIKRFPTGEYTSRCYLGMGRARMLQGDPQVKISAIDSLKIAANDPRYYAEATLWIGEVYSDFGKHDEALAVYRDFIGSEVRTFEQASAAAAVVSILADQGRLDELEAQLGSFVRQIGVRDLIAWFANQMIIRGDELVGGGEYQPALAIYRSVPSRDELLEIQRGALEKMRRRRASLESKVKAEASKPMAGRSNAPILLANLKSTMEEAEESMEAVEEKTDLDAALLRRRGMCLFFLDRYSEALVCFRAIRMTYPEVADAERAAYGEIHTLYFLRSAEIIERSNDFLVRFPHSENAEVVALLAGEMLVKMGDWKGVRTYYSQLEKRFPQSKNLDDFSYKQAEALFHVAEFKEAILRFDQFLKNHPGSPLVEKACYHLAMSYFLNHQNEEARVSTVKYLEKFPDGDFVVDLKRQLGESAPPKETDKGH